MNGRSGAIVAGAIIVLQGRVSMGASDWQSEAAERIERISKGDFTVELVGAGGSAAGAAAVQAQQVRSSFGFGTCVSGNPEHDDPNEKAYFRFIGETFDLLVCENAMKWYATEAEPGVHAFGPADRLLAYAERNGMRMRGHCLFWDKTKYVQKWVQALKPEELRAAVTNHLVRSVTRYRGRLAAWDVNNEMLDGGHYGPRLGADIHAEFFRRARELDPGVPLFVNEYGILDSDEKLDRYCALIRDLQSRGATVGGIGIQEHAVERFAGSDERAAAEADLPEREGRGALVPRDVWRRLDRLGEFGVPIHVTEVSCRTRDPVRRADALEMLYRTAYAHPAVEAILLWGFWEKRHWLGTDAALVRADWTLLPVGERVRRLLLLEWRTCATGRSGADGRFAFRGFFGTYALSATGADGQRMEAQVEFKPGRTSVRAILRPAPG